MTRPFLLLVEDSAEMGLIVTCLGRRAGCEVQVCADASTAREALSRRRPDLVLLDVNLPGVSGVDWLRRVRAAPEFAGLPVALYTHWGLPADVAAGLAAGADFVFDKDLATRPADWQRRLAEILAPGKNVSPEIPSGGIWPNAVGLTTMENGTRIVPTAWIAGLNQVLHHPAIRRRLTGEVLQTVLQRVLTRVIGSQILPKDWEAWIASDGSGLEVDRLPYGLPQNTPMLVTACLAEQMGRLLGAEAVAAFREALTTTLPSLSEALWRP